MYFGAYYLAIPLYRVLNFVLCIQTENYLMSVNEIENLFLDDATWHDVRKVYTYGIGIHLVVF